MCRRQVSVGSVADLRCPDMASMWGVGAGEEIFDKDALWVPEETEDVPPEKQQRYESTRRALKRDRRRMRRAMHKLRARSREFLASDLGMDLSAKRSGERLQQRSNLPFAALNRLPAVGLHVQPCAHGSCAAERARRQEQPSAEDLSKQSSWNAQRQQWRDFWKGTHVQGLPVPNMSGRLLQLITFGQGMQVSPTGIVLVGCCSWREGIALAVAQWTLQS